MLFKWLTTCSFYSAQVIYEKLLKNNILDFLNIVPKISFQRFSIVYDLYNEISGYYSNEYERCRYHQCFRDVYSLCHLSLVVGEVNTSET
jgi:hypothetical protein